MAMTRIKNRKVLRGSANVSSQVIALPTVMQLTSVPTVFVRKIIQDPCISSLDNTILHICKWYRSKGEETQGGDSISVIEFDSIHICEECRITRRNIYGHQ